MQTGLAAWGFFLQARMKEVECSRYRQGHARMEGRDRQGWLAPREELRQQRCAAAVAAHASASQRADRPLQTRPVEHTGTFEVMDMVSRPAKAEYRRARVCSPGTSWSNLELNHGGEARSEPMGRARTIIYLPVTRLRLSFDTKQDCGASDGPCPTEELEKTGKRWHSTLNPRDSRVPRSLGAERPPP